MIFSFLVFYQIFILKKISIYKMSALIIGHLHKITFHFLVVFNVLIVCMYLIISHLPQTHCVFLLFSPPPHPPPSSLP